MQKGLAISREPLLHLVVLSLVFTDGRVIVNAAWLAFEFFFDFFGREVRHFLAFFNGAVDQWRYHDTDGHCGIFGVAGQGFHVLGELGEALAEPNRIGLEFLGRGDSCVLLVLALAIKSGRDPDSRSKEHEGQGGAEAGPGNDDDFLRKVLVIFHGQIAPFSS